MNLKLLTTTTCLATACTISPSSLFAKKATKTNEKPNIVFILIDDLSYFGVGAYGAKSISTKPGGEDFKPINTPNIDKLAEQGIMCTHAYSHPLSEPTRIALMTGMNNGRNFLYPKAIHDSQITFADVFQRAGYATGMYGKWKQTRGTAEIPGEKYISAFGWDDYACFDVVLEMQRYINPNYVENGKRISYQKSNEIDPATGRRYYGPDIFNRKALKFIEDHKDEAFFLYYPMVLVHSEHRPTPDTMPTELFDSMDENKKFNKIEYLADMISYADKMVGRVINKLEELDLEENTIIVLMGDNGSHALTFQMKDGTSHIGGKGRTSYAGEQIPLIFSYPGKLSASKKYESMVDVTDLYPTFLDACGIEIPNKEKIDGISFWKQLEGKNSNAHRDYVYKWYNGNRTQESDSLLARYTHDKRFKYYAPSKFFPKGRFFDLNIDPYERGGVVGPFVSKFTHSNNRWFGGLNIDSLNTEQLAAMKRLAAVNDSQAYTKVDEINITSAPKTMRVGETAELSHKVSPSNATRNGVIWESSDKSIATINKFGEISAHKAGQVTINLYSWDDAWPVATGKNGGYKRDGMKSSVTIDIRNAK